jgi:hypothetical protein
MKIPSRDIYSDFSDDLLTTSLLIEWLVVPLGFLHKESNPPTPANWRKIDSKMELTPSATKR